MTTILRTVLSLAAISWMALPTWAMTMTVEGETVVLSGAVVKADCADLEALLARARITTVVLTNSGGGNADSGYCIGALVRSRGVSTVIRGRCASSCSRMAASASPLRAGMRTMQAWQRADPTSSS